MISPDTTLEAEMAPTGGLEPPTARLEVGYSIQLNYVGTHKDLMNKNSSQVNLVKRWFGYHLNIY